MNFQEDIDKICAEDPSASFCVTDVEEEDLEEDVYFQQAIPQGSTRYRNPIPSAADQFADEERRRLADMPPAPTDIDFQKGSKIPFFKAPERSTRFIPDLSGEDTLPPPPEQIGQGADKWIKLGALVLGGAALFVLGKELGG
jgi:hypothetical protein